MALLAPHALWPRLVAQTAEATRAGALFSIPTTSTRVPDRGVEFLVRVVGNLERKHAQRQALAGPGRTAPDPFSPPDPALVLGDLSPTHVCLLNKFNVMEHHLLVVTRAFEEQERPLTREDFAAAWAALDEIDGLVFYNGGPLAGASQRHKHLQLVTLPLGADGPAVPVAPLLSSRGAGVAQVAALPFAHAVVSSPCRGSVAARAEASLALYCEMWAALGLALAPGARVQPAPYNLLVTRDWTLLVPRRAESFAGASLNALAFAGALLVRNAEQLAALVAAGPMTALIETAGR